MNIIIKSFQELTTSELYNVLQLRSEIFVVEQDCVYQDIDFKNKRLLGNFPQAYSHLALIETAINISSRTTKATKLKGLLS